jgi:type I restriction-modification system DNA methylase subunit
MSGFPYINGGIFAEQLPNFNFNTDMRRALFAATQYDWSTISPAIFGSLFQSVRDAETRREMGEHYTSETNILRCINDLFLNDFYKRMRDAWDSPQALKTLRMELGEYNYLDPACGSGNFLVVAYKRMRDIELRIIARLQELDNKRTQLQLDGSLGLQVHLGQFHGIEIDEWSASIARVAMFLADHQANLALEQITGSAPNRFPLTESAVIVNANALTTDWSEVCPMSTKTYIMGNPPFFGSYLQTKEQKQDVESVWGDVRGAGNLDYVTNWYLIAARHLAASGGRAAFVSTNSVAQGEQPAIIWGELSKLGMRIDPSSGATTQQVKPQFT